MIKNIHEKLLESIKILLVDPRINLPYYGEFNLHINFHEQETIGTCAVNITTKGMNFYYSPSFLKRLSQKEVNFITLHEDFHLIFNHPRRTVTGQYNHKLANIAQDMIINHVIWEDISHDFVEIPKTEDGKNMALFVPKKYTGKLIFEELYEYLKEEKEKWENSKKSNKINTEQESSEDQSNEDQSYGPYGKNPKSENSSLDTWSLDKIFENLDKNEGEYLDKHISDDVPDELRDSMVKEILDRLESRGLSTNSIVTSIGKLRKKKKDYLKYIKRGLSNVMFGTIKSKTIVKPNRRQIPGLKGNRKLKNKINVILDTSGSMGGQGTFEKVLSYVYRNDIEINLMESDTEIKWVERIKSKRRLESIPIKGLGGTALNPAIKYVRENFNDLSTVILTDGETDNLDFRGIKGKVLIISVKRKCPILYSNGKIKQICIND